jgi:hypothetical protein
MDLFFFKKSDDKEKNDSADQGGYQCADDSFHKNDIEEIKQPASDYTADDSDDDISQKAESFTLHDLTGKPAGYSANQNKPDKIHSFPPEREIDMK